MQSSFVPPDRFEIARLLREIGLRLSMAGGQRFRARAYERGAEALEATNQEIGDLISQGRLRSLRGIGPALADAIEELWRTGRSGYLERLRAEMPAGVLELAQLPHVSVSKAKALHQALGVTTIDELEAAARAGRVREVKGFGARTEQAILTGIARFRTQQAEAQTLLLEADEQAGRLLAYLRGHPACLRAEVAGSVRRRRETVGDIDIVVGTHAPDTLIELVCRYPLVTSSAPRDAMEGRGITARLAAGLRLDLFLVPPERFVPALLRATGSAAHLARLPELPPDAASEEQAYGSMGLPFIPPELREDAGEIEAARSGDRFADLVTRADIQGLVHCHTVYSDGKNTIAEMVAEAARLGMKYITITDHSPSAFYAGGVEVDRLKRQWDEIARVQEQHPTVRLLRGTESDILADGALDYPDEVLAKLDVVIASIHSRMKMDESQMTERLIAAMRRPVFKIWGHALGRLLLRRPPFACRVEEVLDAVAESKAAIEVNGDPYRLDLEPRWIRAARRRGIQFVVSTDAHSTGQLANVAYGVDMARRGGLRADEVLNTREVEGFLRAVRPVA